MGYPIPTSEEIALAYELFRQHEPRSLFYRAAIELVDLAMREMTSLTVPEALSVLLQTWNQAYYRYNKIGSKHFTDFEQVVKKHKNILSTFRERNIESLSANDQALVLGMFMDFEILLGPVGAAKSLHLLAPRFFPLWDRAIARRYRCRIQATGTNGQIYWQFMGIVRDQCQQLDGEKVFGNNLLRAIDEYNYCKFTKGWLK